MHSTYDGCRSMLGHRTPSKKTGRDVHDEAQIRDGASAAYEPLLCREDALEHAEDAEDLFLVPLNDAREILRVGHDEPRRLAEVRAAESFDA